MTNDSASSRKLPVELELELELDEPDDLDALRVKAARILRVAVQELPEVAVQRRSLDARRGHVHFQVLLGLGSDAVPELCPAPPREVSRPPQVVVVGDGPAGLFCAYQLARAGVGSVVLDRGKLVQPRRHDLKSLNRDGRVDDDSNYCFGEGGAGTYSDGKLYTRSHKRGSVRDVLEVLAVHGAPPTILTEARPHIGSNLLPKVVSALRESLQRVGVEFRFGARVVRLLSEGVGDGRRVAGVELADGSQISAERVVLATGHSARDVFEMLRDLGVELAPKGFALGVRIEHPQPLINRIQYGKAAGHPKLPSAAYRLAETVEDRGVFSFCMCPGGFVVPASTDAEGLVVNGMSLSKRDSPFANSGLVVSLEPAELAAHGFEGVFAGVEFQRAVERAACVAGGGMLRAPATRVSDFLAGRASSSVPKTSYQPGLNPSNVAEVLDTAGVPLSSYLKQALQRFERRMRGYLSEEAVLIGVESRTSSPVRVVRDENTLEARGLCGLYPCGEGAGYAGGIVSAALDGVRVAEAITREVASGGAP
ncbi:MAG TPA: FAD-dependent oxidoreductase [Polyangiaceae bacterium]|nr:FAD-dependent oxidoreductase [Polyangiaceae bacterium]